MLLWYSDYILPCFYIKGIVKITVKFLSGSKIFSPFLHFSLMVLAKILREIILSYNRIFHSVMFFSDKEELKEQLQMNGDTPSIQAFSAANSHHHMTRPTNPNDYLNTGKDCWIDFHVLFPRNDVYRYFMLWFWKSFLPELETKSCFWGAVSRILCSQERFLADNIFILIHKSGTWKR